MTEYSLRIREPLAPVHQRRLASLNRNKNTEAMFAQWND